jgi:hypothetical protein
MEEWSDISDDESALFVQEPDQKQKIKIRHRKERILKFMKSNYKVEGRNFEFVNNCYRI